MERESSPVERYVDALVDEIGMAEDWAPVHAVNLGGGTPSVLATEQLARILEAISERFGLVAGAEVSIEANPEDITSQSAGGLVAAGFNRISLGIQSFDSGVLRSLGRLHDPRQAREATIAAKAAGIETVNIDLIFGTPGESTESWLETVRNALGLETEHLSAYALTVERGTALSRAVAGGDPGPDPDDQADKYEALAELIELDPYEVSNWARPGAECRYNLTTWAQGEYDAFGLGAHGHRGGVRTRNFRRLDVYLDQVEGGRRPVQGTEQLDPWEREKERLFLGLRLRNGVRAGAAGAALLDSVAGQRFQAAGILKAEAGRLLVTNPLFTDAVARESLALTPVS